MVQAVVDMHKRLGNDRVGWGGWGGVVVLSVGWGGVVVLTVACASSRFAFRRACKY